MHPLRAPAAAPRAALADVGTFVDRLRFGALAARCASYPPGRLLDAPEITSAAIVRDLRAA